MTGVVCGRRKGGREVGRERNGRGGRERNGENSVFVEKVKDFQVSGHM